MWGGQQAAPQLFPLTTHSPLLPEGTKAVVPSLRAPQWERQGPTGERGLSGTAMTLGAQCSPSCTVQASPRVETRRKKSCGLLTALGVGGPRQPGPGCPELPEAREELAASWSPGRHLQPQRRHGWEGGLRMSLSCQAWCTRGAGALCLGPAPSVSRAWHSDALHGGDCGLPATSPWSGHAASCCPTRKRDPGPTCTCCWACSSRRKAFMPAENRSRRATPSWRSRRRKARTALSSRAFFLLLSSTKPSHAAHTSRERRR